MEHDAGKQGVINASGQLWTLEASVPDPGPFAATTEEFFSRC